MNSLKMVYVDIYHTKFEDDGIMPKELIHLHAMDVYTNISVAEIIEQLRLCIYHRYGDGLFIKAEEFQTECFLTVEIFFGDDYSSLTDYLSSINLPHKIPKQISKLTNNDVALSVDFMANQEEIKEL
ncbi:hypothetical protein [Shouchella clausii]|nr:hypothetical protein [Shouchella clausii]KKI85095.1 hypothetical protein WZ76_16700 [Shouchella clausii]